MSYEEIIKVGNNVGLHEVNFWSSFAWWQYILYIGLFLTLSIICLWIAENFEMLGVWSLVLVFIGMVVVLPMKNAYTKYIPIKEKNEQEIEEYKTQYGTPYINSLPVTKGEIFFIKIDTETKVTGDIILGTGTVRSELLTTMTISYKLDGKGITETVEITPDFDLSNGETPYVTYQELTKDLPHYPSGKYNYVIHLPENYSFTDIK